MGIYVNPGNTSFRKAMDDDIYVDKTNLIAYTNDRINKSRCHLCISRPRRFGKSMAADMLVAYYSSGCESAELFAGRTIRQEKSFHVHLNKHCVVRFDVQHFLESKRDVDTFIAEIEAVIVEELMEEFPDCRGFDADSRLKVALNKIFKQTGRGFIIIIDEWDSVFRLAKEHKDAQKEYLDFLRGIFKGVEYVELAYMTGILPIKKYGEHSALNIFEEYSMTDSADLSGYFGFTETEVLELCRRYGVDFAKVRAWYDGYHLGELHIYNPKSVVDAIRRGKFKSYWTGTETYEALKSYIEKNYDGIKEAVTIMLGNGRCKINTRKFQNDMTTFKSKDDVFTLLVHLGYLSYNENTGEAFIPNQEIAGEFLNAVDEPGWDGLMDALDRSVELLKSTWEMDGNAVAEGIAAIHNETASILKYNNENALACAIYIAYYSAKVYYTNPIAELPSGKGFADIVYLPLQHVDRPALVVELKWDQSARGAIWQIKNKQYSDWVQSYTGNILLVGINYDPGTKKHECVIERC